MCVYRCISLTFCVCAWWQLWALPDTLNVISQPDRIRAASETEIFETVTTDEDPGTCPRYSVVFAHLFTLFDLYTPVVFNYCRMDGFFAANAADLEFAESRAPLYVFQSLHVLQQSNFAAFLVRIARPRYIYIL